MVTSIDQDAPNERPAVETIGDDNFSTAATATETSPLLSSASSATAVPGRPSSAITDSDGHADERPPLGPARAASIMAGMAVLVFLQTSNMSGIAVAQGTLAADLAAYESAMWFASAYLIALGATAPLAGRLATVFAPRALVLGAACFFALGAVVSARAGGFAVFILGRALSGVGGGGAMTLSMVLVLQLAEKRRRGLFIGLTNSCFTIGISTGALVFGALLESVGWRALFLLQAPIGIVAGLAVYFGMPAWTANTGEGKTFGRRLAGIDYAGAIFLTLTIVSFLYGLSGGTIQRLPIFLSTIALAIFIGIETLGASDPIIPLRILRSRAVLLSCVSQLIFMAARWTILYYAPVFGLAVRSLSFTAAGAVLVPTNIGFGVGGLLVGALHVRRPGSFWLASLVTLGLFAASLAATAATSTRRADWGLYLAIIFANGLFTGAGLNYTLSHLLHLTRPEDHFVATSLLGTFRGFAGSFGTAIGGGAFSRSLTERLVTGFRGLDGGELGEGRWELVRKLVGSPGLVSRGNLTEAEASVAIQGYEGALGSMYHWAAVLSVLGLLVQAGAGWSAPGPKMDTNGVEEARDGFARRADEEDV